MRASHSRGSIRLEVAAQAGIHLRPVQHGFLTVEIHELLERERVPDDVTRHVFDGLLVLERDRLTDVRREARMDVFLARLPVSQPVPVIPQQGLL